MRSIKDVVLNSFLNFSEFCGIKIASIFNLQVWFAFHAKIGACLQQFSALAASHLTVLASKYRVSRAIVVMQAARYIKYS
jgi:hypothetical protein